MRPEPGSYDVDFAWWGLLARMNIRGGAVEAIELIPLALDEGREYVGEYNPVEFLTRRGFSEVATGALAVEILERFRTLSARYGAAVRIDGERALVDLSRTE